MTEIYQLQSISALGSNTYSLVMSNGTMTIETVCEMLHTDGVKEPSCDYLVFHSEKFNSLCTHGQIHIKPIGKAIFAFHACLKPTEQST